MPGDKGLPKTTARGEPWPREAGALLVKTQFNLETQAGREAYSNVKFYDEEQEWSIGYNVPKGGARVDHKKGLRYIQQLDCFEYSPVLFGAMPLAGNVAVKTHGGMIAGLEIKVVPGSHEERQQAVGAALTKQYADDEYACPVAVFDDHVVYCVTVKGSRQDYQAPYTFEEGEANVGEATPVKVMEMVMADTEDESIDELPTSEEDVETKGGGDQAADDEADDKDDEEDEDQSDKSESDEDDEDEDAEPGYKSLWEDDPIGDALIDPEGQIPGFISVSEHVTSVAYRAWT